MPKIVYAPILEQAGFLKRKTAVVVEQWVAQLDGVMQYWELSEPIVVSAASALIITAYVISTAPPEENTTICCSMGAGATLWVYARLGNFITVKVNGDFRSFDFPTPISGEVQISINETSVSVTHQSVTKSADISPKPEIDISYLASRSGGSAFLSGYIKDFEVTIDNVLKHKLQLTNKAQGATQLATVGNINAFMPNYTNAVWRKL